MTESTLIDVGRLHEAIPRALGESLRSAVGEVARERSEAVWAVGGLPRDLLIGREPGDIDLVVLGDGLAFATALGRRLEAPIRLNERFLTAELDPPQVGRVDVSTARREVYDRPGALPRVEPGGLDDDLARRDFTVNTLAVGVAGGVEGRLDAHPEALRDLESRAVSILHPESFLDDPTRLLRGVDVEIAIAGRMTSATQAAARAAVAGGALETLSSERLLAALPRSLFRASSAEKTVARLDDLGLLTAVLPIAANSTGVGAAAIAAAALGVLERLEAIETTAPAAGESPGKARLRYRRRAAVVLGASLGAEDSRRREWLVRFSPERGLRLALSAWSDRTDAALEALRVPDLPVSGQHRALASLTLSELAVVAVAGGAFAEAAVLREVESSRRLTLRIGASDLLDAGVSAGPSIGRALDDTLAARLDGRVEEDGELAYALRSIEGA